MSTKWTPAQRQKFRKTIAAKRFKATQARKKKGGKQ